MTRAIGLALFAVASTIGACGSAPVTVYGHERPAWQEPEHVLPAEPAKGVPLVSRPLPAPPPASLPSTDRDRRIHEQFGDACRFERSCNSLWGIDCNAAADGPYYYVKAETLEIVAECGGVCMGPGGCPNCPPEEWTCPAY